MSDTDTLANVLEAAQSLCCSEAAAGLRELQRDLEISRAASQAETDRANRLEAALRDIAAGDGYYGAQAREYKQIARSALIREGLLVSELTARTPRKQTK